MHYLGHTYAKKMIHCESEIQISLGVRYFHLQNLATLSKPSSEWCGKGRIAFNTFFGTCTSGPISSGLLVCPETL